jgi:hypothetical protein
MEKEVKFKLSFEEACMLSDVVSNSSFPECKELDDAIDKFLDGIYEQFGKEMSER